MKNNTPQNKNIIYFLLTFFLSFIYFFNVYFIAIFYFIYYFFTVLLNKITNKEKIFFVECTNNYENSFLFYYKEMVFNYAKSKAFLCYYNFLKIIYKKKEKKNIKLLVFSYIFKRIFKFITLIPFTIFKINCTIYRRSKNIIEKDYKKSSLKAIIDHILLNLYLEKISEEIAQISNYKIKIKNKIIEFNPPKADKNFFKGSFEYFNKKRSIENMSEFAVLKNKKEKNGFVYKHICKRFNVFLEDFKYLKYPLFTETKSNKIVDKYGNEIKSKLNDIGSKNENIKTNKIRPFIVEKKNNNDVLEELKGSDIRIIKEIKNKTSWQLLQEMYYNEETLHLDDENIVYKKHGETLRDFYKRYYNYLNDVSKNFLNAKEKFDSENNDIKKNMTESEYEKSLKNDFDRWNSSFNDYESDFNKKHGYKEGKNNNNFTGDFEYDDN